jgi:alpha-tubulin suppressor-like RCC1 family protein
VVLKRNEGEIRDYSAATATRAAATEEGEIMQEEVVLENITSVDLGLQHGLALDTNGNLYGWGKGARGQLGQSKVMGWSMGDREVSAVDMEYAAIPIDHFEVTVSLSSLSSLGGKDHFARTRLSGNDAKVRRMSAGWNHSCCVTESNHVFTWGKNAWAEKQGDNEWKAVDSPYPTLIEGLPSHLEVKDVSCGSHHTSILMEDGSVYAMGIATDTAKSIGTRPVQIVPPGLIDPPVIQFSSHFDRTTIVAGGQGDENRQILEVQLWSTEELRESAVFEPGWVDTLTQDGSRVLNVQRGWLHTVVITESKGKGETDHHSSPSS